MALLELKRVLKVYDNTAIAKPQVAVTMLRDVTKTIATKAVELEIAMDPSDAEKWMEAGGPSYCDNIDFPNLVGKRWMEVLSKPDIHTIGMDKIEWYNLQKDIEDWAKLLDKEGLEFEKAEEIGTLIKAIMEKAPEPEDSSDDEDDSDDE